MASLLPSSTPIWKWPFYTYKWPKVGHSFSFTVKRRLTNWPSKARNFLIVHAIIHTVFSTLCVEAASNSLMYHATRQKCTNQRKFSCLFTFIHQHAGNVGQNSSFASANLFLTRKVAKTSAIRSGTSSWTACPVNDLNFYF